VHGWLGWGDRRNGYHFENLGVGRRIILKWIFKKWNGGGGGAGRYLSGPRIDGWQV